MPDPASKAVFLSYASQDAEPAKRICEALRADGVEVWFDQDALVGGDAWDGKIRGQIASCALFIPVISAATQERLEGYFRIEWKLAAERTHAMAEERAFLLPVVIDATRDAEGKVPTEFRAVQWTKLPGGETSALFVARVQKLLGGPIGVVATSAPGSAQPSAPAQAAGSGLPRWVGVAVGVVVLALIGYVVTRRGAKDATTEPRSVAETKTLPVAVPAPMPLPAEKSIAVLPFANLSDDKQNTDFFADGMHEDILTNLANIPELRVVSRTSVMEYRGSTKKIPQIAQELGVAYILEGSVRRSGNQVRITGQLIRAAKDQHLWAKSYDRELTPKEVFAIQAALSTEIAGALRAAITPETQKLLERRPTENLAAYELYLKARALHGPFSSRTVNAEREKLFRAAVELDPKFAEAWGELASVHTDNFIQQFDRTPARLALADAAITRALLLAPDSPEVVRLTGDYAYFGYYDYAKATEQYLKVIRLQPNNPEAIFKLGAVQRRQGRWREAITNMRRAVELDPASAIYVGQLGNAFSVGRRWEESLAMARRVVSLVPADSPSRLWWMRAVFSATGSRREVDDWIAQLTPAQRESPSTRSILKTWARLTGDYAEWKRLDILSPDEAHDWEEALNAALLMAAQGDAAEARTRLKSFPTELRAELERQPANSRMWVGLSVMEALLGQKEEALRDAQKAVEIMPRTLDALEGAFTLRSLAVVYAWTGERGRAVAELSRLLESPLSFGSVHFIRTDPAFFPLRGDPRFEALLNDPKNNAPLF